MSFVEKLLSQKCEEFKSILGTPVGGTIKCRDGWFKREYTNLGSSDTQPVKITGAVYANVDIGVFVVYGAIYARYAALNVEKGLLGFPKTDESAAGSGGRYNHFEKGSIYWTQATGAHP